MEKFKTLCPGCGEEITVEKNDEWLFCVNGLEIVCTPAENLKLRSKYVQWVNELNG